jgi:hypothetical protein
MLNQIQLIIMKSTKIEKEEPFQSGVSV